MPDRSVGGSIVVGGWESQPQGEGSQKFDTPLYSLAASLANAGRTGSTTGCEREEDNNAKGNLGSEMPNFGEPDALKGCAMSRTEEIATTGGRSSRQMTPRRTTYLTLKGGGDRSLLLTRGVAEDVYATALQRLSDRAKAGLPEPQCPGVECAHPSVARLYADARESRRFNFCRRYALLVGRWLMKPFKGMSAEPTSLYSFRSDGTWDGLRGASPRATESQ